MRDAILLFSFVAVSLYRERETEKERGAGVLSKVQKGVAHLLYDMYVRCDAVDWTRGKKNHIAI